MHTELSDQQFLEQIRVCQLDPKYFNHTGHLRLAWLLSEQATAQSFGHSAVDIIKDYAHSLGATEKFHFTITAFLEALVAIRQKKGRYPSWQVFIEANPDLNLDCLGVLNQYYDHDILCGEEAKRRYVGPNKKKLED